MPPFHLKAIPKDHPHRRQLGKLEKEAQAIIEKALSQMRRDLFRDIDTGNVRDMLRRINSQELNEKLRSSIYDALLLAAQAGGTTGQTQVEREVLGTVKAPPPIPAFDWTLVNSAVMDWVRDYSFALSFSGAMSITAATEKVLQREIANFVETGDMTITQLGNRLAPMFDATRAEMIAVTEVTRAFAEGNRLAWQESGVVERKRWNTANDELVCPICGPLNGTVVDIDGLFDSNYDGPPAHPRCRCWITPVVGVPTDEDILDDEINAALDSGAGFDIFEGIRPPAGRAPRGMGKEYADRRAIVNKIQAQIRNRNSLQATINNYRGQQNRTWQITHARLRIQELNKGIDSALEFAQQPADWDFKRAMINDIFEYISKLTRSQ